MSLANALRVHLSRIASADRKQWRTFERSERAATPYASEQAKENSRARAAQLEQQDKERRTLLRRALSYPELVELEALQGWHVCQECGCKVIRCEHEVAREKGG